MFALTWLPSLAASAAASCACACCTQLTSTALRSSARMAWSLLFSASLIVAWIARDWGSTLLKKLPCAWAGGGPGSSSGKAGSGLNQSRRRAGVDAIAADALSSPLLTGLPPSFLPPPAAGVVRHFSGGDLPPDAWFGQQAVYRISLGNFVSAFAL